MSERLVIKIEKQHLKRFGITTYGARLVCKLGNKTLWSKSHGCNRLTKSDAIVDGKILLAAAESGILG